MPYRATRELPAAVRRTLTPAQQRVYIEAFNRAWERGWSEARCHAYAWAAAKRAAEEKTAMKTAAAQLLRDLAAIMDAEEGGEIEKAVWTRAYINDLPDSAFLYIAPGGRKDEDGKTVPRSLRYFPYRDASGAIDLPHLRNAIARAPQSDLPRAVVERIQERARRILAEQQKSAAKHGAVGTVLKYDDERQVVYGVVYEPHVVDAQGDYADEDAIMDAAHSYMLGGAVVKLDHAEETDQAAVVESYIAPVDFELGGEPVRAGSWVMAVKVADAELWQRVKGGEYEGYSFGGEVLRTGGGVIAD